MYIAHFRLCVLLIGCTGLFLHGGGQCKTMHTNSYIYYPLKCIQFKIAVCHLPPRPVVLIISLAHFLYSHNNGSYFNETYLDSIY